VELSFKSLNHFLFNPYKEHRIESPVRLVIYNNKKEKFDLLHVLDIEEAYSLSLGELESHLDYKYKYQIMDESSKRWVDHIKYARLLPEAQTEEGIKYLFYPNRNSDKLIVVFQAINTTPSYNYIKTIKDETINRLYIKDDYGEDEATKSSYYLGKNKTMNIFHATQKLINSVVTELNIEKVNVIFAGSSKGGFASIYHGYHFGCGYILAGGPQILLGNYLGHKSEKSILPPIFHYLAGEVNEENKKWANDLMLNCLKQAKNPFPKTIVHVGRGEPHYKDHVLPFVELTNKLEINNVELDVENYNTHEELATFFPIFLQQKVNEIINEKNSTLKSVPSV
jgi:accessory secretory protein Asp2